VQQLLNLNIMALTELTCLFLPYLKKAARHYSSIPKSSKGYSLSGLMNISSVAGQMTLPYMAIYAASKAFVTSFTEALHHELMEERSPLAVVAVLPGATPTSIWERVSRSILDRALS